MGKIKSLLILACVVLSLIGVTTGIMVNDDNKKLAEETTVTLQSGKSESLSGELEGFYPTRKETYEVKVSADDCSVSLEFANSDDGMLKDFINVTVKTKNGDVVASGLLADVLRRGEIRLGENIGGIIVEYEMPIDVGNEAQGKTVSFDIILSAQRISE